MVPGVLADLALHHDHAGTQAGRLGVGGQAAGHHGQVPPREHHVRAHRQPQGAEPVQLLALVGRHAEAPGPVRAAAQAAFDRAAATLEQEAAGWTEANSVSDDKLILLGDNRKNPVQFYPMKEVRYFFNVHK